MSDFVTLAAPGEREQLLLRHLREDEVELRVVVPDCAWSDALVPSRLSDSYLQLLEGVSHFVLLAERIRTGRQTSHLELELQAEVDKLVLVEHCLASDRRRSATLHEQLYENAHFLHAADTERGERYRLANQLAARFTKRLAGLGAAERRARLRRFYRVSLSDKVHLSQAA